MESTLDMLHELKRARPTHGIPGSARRNGEERKRRRGGLQIPKVVAIPSSVNRRWVVGGGETARGNELSRRPVGRMRQVVEGGPEELGTLVWVGACIGRGGGRGSVTSSVRGGNGEKNIGSRESRQGYKIQAVGSSVWGPRGPSAPSDRL